MITKASHLTTRLALLLMALATVTFLLTGSDAATEQADHVVRQRYIVQADTMSAAAAAVADAGGAITHELAVINAVGTTLTAAEAARLEAAGLRLYADRNLEVAGGGNGNGGGGGNGGGNQSVPETYYPGLIGANNLHGQGITGSGVAIAVIDTGYYSDNFVKKNTTGVNRMQAHFDAINNTMVTGPQPQNDQSGHGTHVSSAAMSSGLTTSSNQYQGVAPDAELVVVEAFDGNGAGNYLDVIRGIDWVVANKDTYNIRVVNLSFSASPQSYYWDDPLNQAVMHAWQAGIVVVAAAGNAGPDPMTIGVPGNIPYVITVGAFSDNYTPSDKTDDYVTSFSSAGPTVEAFVKPDVVAPGGHITGIMEPSANLATAYPEYQIDGRFFTMSGTSQATAITSGVVALMLQVNPTLSPDEVKCRLMDGARAFTTGNGNNVDLAYAVFQQGAGAITANGAINSSASGCANVGLNINADLDGTQHFEGPADMNDNGDYYVVDADGNSYTWSGGSYWAGGFAWSGGSFWAGSFAWSGGSFWAGSFAWSGGSFWAGNVIWSDANMAVNQWVNQE